MIWLILYFMAGLAFSFSKEYYARTCAEMVSYGFEDFSPLSVVRRSLLAVWLWAPAMLMREIQLALSHYHRQIIMSFPDGISQEQYVNWQRTLPKWIDPLGRFIRFNPLR